MIVVTDCTPPAAVSETDTNGPVVGIWLIVSVAEVAVLVQEAVWQVNNNGYVPVADVGPARRNELVPAVAPVKLEGMLVYVRKAVALAGQVADTLND